MTTLQVAVIWSKLDSRSDRLSHSYPFQRHQLLWLDVRVDVSANERRLLSSLKQYYTEHHTERVERLRLGSITTFSCSTWLKIIYWSLGNVDGLISGLLCLVTSDLW